MVRYHSWVSESMAGVLWDAFEYWLSAENQPDLLELYNCLHLIINALKNNDSQNLRVCHDLVQTKLISMKHVWDCFLNNVGVTAKDWSMYIDMVTILKEYIHAERVGDRNENLASVEIMLPYTVPAQHTKYMICLPMYLRDMRDLEQTHPDVFSKFMEGKFTVHHLKGKFNGVWTDMAFEQTYNREGKTSLLKGISQAPISREKYVKTIPFLTKILKSVKAMADVGESYSYHHGESDKSIVNNFQIVENRRSVITEQMVNHSSCSNKIDLINIATGHKASTTDIINARQRGEDALRQSELEQSQKIVVPRLTTFASRTHNSKSSVVKIYQEESAVTRALFFCQSADDETRKKTFSHEWTDYPSSLFDLGCRLEDKYSMRNACKSDFLKKVISETGTDFD